MKTVRISDEALAVLSGCSIEPHTDGSVVYIGTGQLDRKLYVEVNKVLEEIGGE